MFKNYVHDPKDPSGVYSFEIHDIDLAIVNGIRRTILTDIPIFGMCSDEDNSTIDIIKNNGPLHNEIIIHRIGLIPISLKEDELESYEDDYIEIELNVENKANNMINITTKDIKGKKNEVELTPKELSQYFPENDITKSHILITRLRTGEHLHFKARFVKKTSRHNASFSPVSLCNFYFMQDPKIAKLKDNILDKERSFYTNSFGEPNMFKFEIEPINKHVGPKYLINKSIEIIIEKINNLILNIISEDINIEMFNTISGNLNTYEFTIDNEDDTLGNIIQSYIHDKYVRKKSGKGGEVCSYIGYICPHPLKTELLIRITLENETNKVAFVKFLETNCRKIIEELDSLKSEWNKFIK